MNDPPDHQTLLLVPTWYGGPPVEIVLPLPATSYAVHQQGDRSMVVLLATGELIYRGFGPAEVVVSRVPS